MRNKLILLFVTLGLTASYIFAVGDVSNAVPAISNESLIEGVVSEYAIITSDLVDIKPAQTLYRLTIIVTSSRNIGEGPDYLSDMTGQGISLLSKKKLSPELFGRKVKVKARYKGDERGGTLWISNIEAIDQERAQ
ncbi:MAG: hypothetical protein ISR96_13135 [Nitrospira sp.]|nr:hypothetical protein [Nitrospira sp.]